MTFLIIGGKRHWLSISNLFKKNIKVKKRQCPDYILLEDFNVETEEEGIAEFSNLYKLKNLVKQNT